MNKLTKSAIAGAVGIALLLGGAGSLAYWNADASLSGGTITAGELTIAANGSGSWSDAHGAISMATFHAVPGDVLTYTANFNVTAIGDNLSATVALTGDSIAAASVAPADVKLASLLTKSAVTKVGGVATTTVNAAAGTQTVSISVQITWPNGASADDNAAMNGVVDLSGMTITVTQNP